MNTVKWGFGMAPLKPSTDFKNRLALHTVQKFVIGKEPVTLEDLIHSISWVKGIFNRIIRQDQWDWFTVNMYLDYPTYHDMKNIVKSLQDLRVSLLSKDESLGRNSLLQLQQNHFLTYCNNYLQFNVDKATPEDYIYIYFISSRGKGHSKNWHDYAERSKTC